MGCWIQFPLPWTVVESAGPPSQTPEFATAPVNMANWSGKPRFQSTTTQRPRRLALWAKGIPGSPEVTQGTVLVSQSQTTSPLAGVFMLIATYRPDRSMRGSRH